MPEVSMLGDARRGKLPANLMGFGRALRRAGLPMDTSRMALALQAVLLVGIDRRPDLRAALQAVLVSQPQDMEVFEQLFDAYFRDPQLAQQLLAQMLPKAPAAAPIARKPRVQEALQAPAAARRTEPTEQEVQLDAAMSASDRERLRQADFASLNASEYRLIEQLVRQIPLDLPPVTGRRTRAGSRGALPHWASTLRQAARFDGDVFHLPRRERQDVALPLLVLVDVSGSMERYARLLLAFLHAATRNQPRAVYAVGTRLTDLRPAFRQLDTDRMLAMASTLMADYAGGTRLGDCLASLRHAHARQLVGRRTVVLIISDGLDTGEPAELDRELAWLKRHSRQLVWLNPLLRFAGYAPLAQGAQVLHRHADAMLAVHNLSRLEDLAQALAKLLRQRGA